MTPDEIEGDAIEPVDPMQITRDRIRGFADRMANAKWLKCPWCAREFLHLDRATINWQGVAHTLEICSGCRGSAIGILGLANDFQIEGANVDRRIYVRARDREDPHEFDHYGVVSRDGREFLITSTAFRVRVKDSLDPEHPKDFPTVLGAWAWIAARFAAPETEIQRPRKAGKGSAPRPTGQDAAAGEDTPGLWAEI